MLSTIAYVFGFVLLVVGVLGFVPAATPGGLLLGLFSVNTCHNIVHLVTGALALTAGYTGWSKLFFQIFGVVYLLVALAGIYYGDMNIFGMVANNTADVVLHFVIAFISLFLGFTDVVEK